MTELEILKKRIYELESELESYKVRESELEYLIEQYNMVIKQEFDSFDGFINGLVTKQIIDDNTRVYSKTFFIKLFNMYYQKVFELNSKCGIVILNVPDIFSINEKEKLILERNIGKVLRESVRIPLDIVARYSESKFVILLTDIEFNSFEKIIKRIKNSLEIMSKYSNNISIKKYYIPKDFVSNTTIFNELEN